MYNRGGYFLVLSKITTLTLHMKHKLKKAKTNTQCKSKVMDLHGIQNKFSSRSFAFLVLLKQLFSTPKVCVFCFVCVYKIVFIYWLHVHSAIIVPEHAVQAAERDMTLMVYLESLQSVILVFQARRAHCCSCGMTYRDASAIWYAWLVPEDGIHVRNYTPS